MLPFLLRALGLLPLALLCLSAPDASATMDFVIRAGDDVVVVRGAGTIVMSGDSGDMRLAPDGSASFSSDEGDRLLLNDVDVEGKAVAGPGDVVSTVRGQGDDAVVTHTLTVEGGVGVVGGGGGSGGGSIGEFLRRATVPGSRKAIGVTTVSLGEDRAVQMGLDPDEVLVVADVRDGMPAKKLLRTDDVIVAVDGRPLVTRKLLVESVQSRDVGETITLTILRDGDTTIVEVPVATLPDQEVAGGGGVFGALSSGGGLLEQLNQAQQQRLQTTESLLNAKRLLSSNEAERRSLLEALSAQKQALAAHKDALASQKDALARVTITRRPGGDEVLHLKQLVEAEHVARQAVDEARAAERAERSETEATDARDLDLARVYKEALAAVDAAMAAQDDAARQADLQRNVADTLRAEMLALESKLAQRPQSVTLLPGASGARTLVLPPSGLRGTVVGGDQMEGVEERLDSIDERLARIEKLLSGLDLKALLR